MPDLIMKQEESKKGVNWTKWTAIGTLLYFVATVVFVIVMIINLSQIKESNAISRKTLELSRQSFETQYRPALYLDDLKPVKSEIPDTGKLRFWFKNFGIVAAKGCIFNIDITKKRSYVLNLILHTHAVEAISPPQGKLFIEEKFSKKELKEGLFAHIFVSYTGVSKLSKTQRSYYVLIGTIKIESQGYRKDIDWDEIIIEGPLPDSVILNYEEKDLWIEVFKENGKIERL